MNEPRIVLVVDDEPPLLRLMSRLVEKAGHRPLTAPTGEAARELFAAHRDEIVAVLLDVSMPEDDGAERLMPEFLEARPTLRVIVTSGDEPPRTLEAECVRVGATFLRKPFPPKSLLRLLGDAAPLSSAPSPSPGPA